MTRELRRDSAVRIGNFFGITPEALYESGVAKADRIPAAETVEEIYKRIAMLSITERAVLFDRMSINLK